MLAATLIVPTQAFHSGRLVFTMMHSFRSGRYLYHSSLNEDIMVKKVLQTHSPDGRHIDPEPILQVVEDIMGQATATKVLVFSATLVHVLFVFLTCCNGTT